jgi:hypothetical protein
MGTGAEWTKVLFLGVFWAFAMLLWSYIRRMKHVPGLGSLPMRARYGGLLSIAFLSLDFGFLTTFWTRAFHGKLLFIFVMINVGLTVIILAFGLLSPSRSIEKG